jgi:hypothetical protein
VQSRQALERLYFHEAGCDAEYAFRDEKSRAFRGNWAAACFIDTELGRGTEIRRRWMREDEGDVERRGLLQGLLHSIAGGITVVLGRRSGR